MALKKSMSVEGNLTVTLPGGFNFQQGTGSIDLPDCYIKVERVLVSKTEGSADVSFSSGSIKYSKAYQFPVTLDGGNFISQAYDHLKSLPEYKSAKDC